MAVVLREEVSLLDLQLGEVVVAYVEHLEREGELELEVATEFLVLIAALLELKSRLMLPGPEDELDDLSPEEAVEELLARMLEYRRYRDASASPGRPLREPSAATSTARRRCRASCAASRVDAAHRRLRPRPARRRARRPADRAARRRHQPHPPDRLARAPPARPARRPPPPHQLRLRRGVRRRGPAHPGGHRLRPARALPQGRDHLGAGASRSARSRCARAASARVNDLSPHRRSAALPLAAAGLRRRPGRGDRGDRGPGRRGDRAAARGPRRGQARDRPARGLRRLRPRQRPGQRGSGPAPAREAADAAADPGPGRDPGDRRLPAAGLPARGRPDPRRLLGVGGADAWPSAA